MAWNKSLIGALIAFYLSFSTASVYAATCNELRDFFQKSNLDSKEINNNLLELQELEKSDDLCAKNLIGRLNYEGLFIPLNKDNAKNIFVQLSDRDYPPAMFNLAYALSEEKPSDPKTVIGLLLGIYVTYVGSKEYGYLAIKSMDYGRTYIDSLKISDRTALSKDFENALSQANTQARNKVQERLDRANELGAALGNILLVGLAFGVGMKLGAATTAPRVTNNYYYSSPTTYYQSPTLYGIYSPGPGQGLYALPLR